MAARSHRFAVVFGPAVANTTYAVYTCPTGRRAIVRHLQIRSLAACTTAVGFYDGATHYLCLARVDAAAVPGGDLPCWLVLNPGDQLEYRCSVANNVTVVFNGVEVEI